MTVLMTLSQYEFEQQFRNMDRDYYSSEGYEYLYEMLDELDASLDVIAICCEWNEYADAKDLLGDYGYLVDEEDYEDEDELLEALLDELEYRTYLVRLSNGGYLIQVF